MKSKYGESLFDTEDWQCYQCKAVTQTARHEVIYGIGNREISQKWGLWIAVCPNCHRLIHENPVQYHCLQEMAQRLFEEKYGHEKFMKLYGRNYIGRTESG